MRRLFFFLTALLLILLILEYRVPSFAAMLDRTLGAPLRALLARASARVEAPLAERILLSSPILLLSLAVAAFFAAQSRARTRRLVSLMLVPLLALFAVYALAFAPGHLRAPLAEEMGWDTRAPSDEEVLDCVAWLSSLAAAQGKYPGDAAVEADLRAAFSAAGARYGFAANTAVPVKQTATPLLLRLGYFGLYAFPLGEIILTAACPEATRAFTLAHEMAHASGFSREADADAVALLTCLESGNAYLVGAAASGMLGRALSALYESAPELWERASGMIPDTARRELSDAGDVYENGAYETGAPAARDYAPSLRLLCALYRARHTLREG